MFSHSSIPFLILIFLFFNFNLIYSQSFYKTITYSDTYSDYSINNSTSNSTSSILSDSTPFFHIPILGAFLGVIAFALISLSGIVLGYGCILYHKHFPPKKDIQDTVGLLEEGDEEDEDYEDVYDDYYD
eukprot:TRINITY_DN9368_c0_g1_i1.p1 TRINITY_DN9368_c0_g1~~TRINITY_DN9368_c0_g1_i1.p1  ORF type:complete len:129 (+),score=27.60 TRINITY_DN9368_c0_g1_i1:176-562(+)